MVEIDDRKITIIYNKVALSSGYYFLYPQKAEIGRIYEEVDEAQRFITEDGKVYYPISNKDALNKENVLLFDDYDELTNEIEYFLSTTKKEDIITNLDLDEIRKTYFESFEEDIMFAWFDNNGVVGMHLDLCDLAEKIEVLNSDTSYAFGDDFLKLLLESENLDEMKKLLKEVFGLPRPEVIIANEEGISLDLEDSSNKKNQLSKVGIKTQKEKQKIDVQELEDFVNERVIGHKDEISDIVTTLVLNQQTDDYREIERILVAGPTGIGKTETFESIAEYLKVPFANYAVTTLSDTGLVGKDVDDILKYVYFKADGNIEKTKKAIIILDEIDKIAIRGNEASQLSVQQNLLKLLEGHTFDVQKSEYSNAILIDTRFMSFVGCGAFPSLFEEKKKIGIRSNEVEQQKNPTLQDFFRFGMIEELMGRFGQIHIYKPLTDLERYQVLTVSKISPFIIKQQQFQKNFNVSLNAEPSYYDAILESTKNSSIGLRSLKTTVNRSLLRLENQLLKEPGIYKDAIVSQETVKDAKQYILK